MRELIQLMNQWRPDFRIDMVDGLISMENWVESMHGAYATSYIISRPWWFIKWLFEKDYIKLHEAIEATKDYPRWTVVEKFIMYLSVKEYPLQELIKFIDMDLFTIPQPNKWEDVLQK